jgi:hypothetical protein
VIPQKRGQALTKQMYQFILPILKAKGVNALVLEVIMNNIQEIKSYEQSDYETVRRLACYKGDLKPLKNNANLTIKTMHKYDWNLVRSFWNITPTWQNSTRVMDALIESYISLGTYVNDRLIDYVIYNPKSKRI